MLSSSGLSNHADLTEVSPNAAHEFIPPLRMLGQILVQQLRGLGFEINQSQESEILNHTETNYSGCLMRIGVLSSNPKQELNAAMVKAITNRSASTFTLMKLGADPIVKDAQGNNYLHIFFGTMLKAAAAIEEPEKKILERLLYLGRSTATPLQLLTEKNAMGLTPVDFAEIHWPVIMRNALQLIAREASQGNEVAKTLDALFMLRDAPISNHNEINANLRQAALLKERNAQVLWAKRLIQLGALPPPGDPTLEMMLQEASANGLAEADYLLGKHIYTNDSGRQRGAIERAALRSHDLAQHLLAKLIALENPGNENHELVFYWAKKSADQGNARATKLAVYAALLLANTKHAQNDKDRAKELYAYAAMHNSQQGQCDFAHYLLDWFRQPENEKTAFQNLLKVIKHPESTTSENGLRHKLGAAVALFENFESSEMPCSEQDLINMVQEVISSEFADAELKADAQETLKRFKTNFLSMSSATSRLHNDF